MAEPETKSDTVSAGRRGVFLGALAGIAALFVGKAPAAALEPAPGSPLAAGGTTQTQTPTNLLYTGRPEESALRVQSGNEAALLGAGTEDLARAVRLSGPARAGGAFVGANLGAAALSPGTVAFLAVQGEVVGGPVDISNNPAAGWFRSDGGAGLVGISMGNIGVAAVSGGKWQAPDVQPTALWARGFGNSGGIEAETDVKPAVVGESQGGSGVVGSSNGGGYGGATGQLPLSAPGVAGVFGVGGGGTTGTWGRSKAGNGAWGQSDTGIGVAGESNNIGAWFKKGSMTIDSKTLEPAALHTTAMGTDISGCFRAEKGIAVMAETSDPKGMAIMAEAVEGGIAISAMGRIQMNMAGKAMIKRGTERFEVVCSDVNDFSHISVTPRSDMGTSILFVEVLPGFGFAVNFDKKTKRDGLLSFAITEAMPPH